MSGIRIVRSAAVIALLLPACAQTAPRASRAALDEYARAFAPREARAIANAVEVIATRIDPGAGDGVRLAGADGSREVHVRMLEPTDWNGVARLTARADPGSRARLPDATLEAALAGGLVADHAELRAGRATLTLRLTDVSVPGSERRAEWVDVRLHFVRVSAATRAAVAAAGPANGAASVTRLGGD